MFATYRTIGGDGMKEIKITDECIIYNDMPRGWIRGEGQPRWHRLMYDRWRNMWSRCKSPSNKSYANYKDCEIDESYRYLSIYVKDVISLPNFDKLCSEPSKWEVDKDKKDPNNRIYSYEHLSIVTKSDNIKERNNRVGNPNPPKSVIGIPILSGPIYVFNDMHQAEDFGFYNSHISACCLGKRKSHGGYKWYYLNIIKF